MKLHELIVEESRKALGEQRPDGSLPPGHNGPYYHPERPARNTAHWLMLFLKAYELTDDDVFAVAAHRCADYLLSPADRPHGKNWWHRTAPQRDKCNGLIGCAWCVEALVEAHEKLGREDALKLAEEVWLLHPQDPETGLWHRVEPDGSVESLDLTFNHQLWFAAAGGLLAKAGSKEAEARVEAFLAKFGLTFALLPDGMVRHLIVLPPGLMARIPKKKKPLWLKVYHTLVPKHLRPGRTNRPEFDESKRDVGYHAFNLIAFAMLKDCFPDHPFWQSGAVEKMKAFAFSPEHIGQVEDNKYAYPYNPVGYEVAVFLSAFDPGADRQIWVQRQITADWDRERKTLGRDSDDKVTARARLYEALRLDNVEFKLP